MRQAEAKPWDELSEEERQQYGQARYGEMWNELTPEEQHKYGRVRYENERRDGNAEWREWRAWWLAGGAILTTIICAVGMVWFAMRGQRVQVMVQVVQHEEPNRLVKIGVPHDLLDYEPPEGAYRDMLAHWVDKKNSRDDALSEVRARQDWRWLYLHTCEPARKDLEKAERLEKPFDRKIAKTVKVEVDSVTKTLTPQSYQVLWKSTTSEKLRPQAEETWWTTTFTVGRVAPKNLSDATLNQLGLCVTGFDDDKRH